MKQIASNGRFAHIASPVRFLPVLVPAVALALLTGVGRVGRQMTTPAALQTRSANGAQRQPLVANVQYNSTEETFASYQKAGALISDGRDQEALALLNALGNAALSAEGDSFQRQSMRDFSPVTLMMSLADRIGRHTEAAEKRGDYATAHRYVEALYQIGDRMASSENPCFQSVKIAYHYHCLAAQSEADLAARTGARPDMMAQYRLTALRTLWKVRILPRIQNDEPGALPTAVAYQVSREYRDEWSRIRAGEA